MIYNIIDVRAQNETMSQRYISINILPCIAIWKLLGLQNLFHVAPYKLHLEDV